jgi:cytosol alanyl aminopeptidase
MRIHINRVLPVICMLLLAITATRAPAEAANATDSLAPPSAVPRGPLPRTVTPRHYQLDLVVLPERERYSGHIAIRVDVTEPTAHVWMHGRDLAVSEAHAIDHAGRKIPARYRQVHADGVAELTLAEPMAAGTATLVLSYDAPFQTRSLDGLARITDGQRTYVASDAFPLDARLIFPGFDEPAFKAAFELSVTTHRSNAVITNTPELRTEQLPDELKRVTFAESVPLPSYVFFVAVGDFDVVPWRAVAPNGVRDHAVPLRGIAGKGKGAKLRYALENTEGILGELEAYLGIAYPYAKLDLIVPPGYGGGMENAAAIIYGERYLLFDERSSPIDERGYAFVHAHELSHQWFGNLVTPAWWDDLWLNEAFASWLANRTIALWAPQRGFDRDTQKMGLAAMARDSRAGAQSFRRPVRTADDLAGRMNPLIFDKGAAVIAMFESYLGEDVFQRAVRRYLSKSTFGNVRAQDFLKTLDETAQSDIGRAVQTFIEQPGIPLLDVDWRCDGSKVVVEVEQSRYLPLGSRLAATSTWRVPMCFAYEGNGKRERRCELLDGQHETLAFDVKQCPAVLMPNARGSGYYRFTLPAAKFRSLVAHVDQMDAAEALALEDSLAAAMNAGTLDVTDYLAAVPQLAAHPSWDVAIAPLPRLVFVLRHLLRADEREKTRRLARELYQPKLDRIGLDADSPLDRSNPDETALLREALIPFLALEAPAPAVSKELIEIARAYTGWRGDGKLHPGIANRTSTRTALAVAARDLGRPFTDHLWRLFQSSSDAAFRSDVLRAFASVTDPALALWVRGLILRPELDAGEAQELFTKQAEVAENFDASWTWQKENFPVLAARAASAYEHETLLSVAANFCSRGAIEDVRASLGPVAAGFSDGAAMLDTVVEQIEMCAALKDRQLRAAGSYR